MYATLFSSLYTKVFLFPSNQGEVMLFLLPINNYRNTFPLWVDGCVVILQGHSWNIVRVLFF